LTRHTVAQHYPRSTRGRRRRFLLSLLMLPFVFGVVAAPAAVPSPVIGDQLTDAQAQQKALERKIADQKKLIASLTSSQARLQGQIAQTKTELDGVTQDLTATRRQVTAMEADVRQIQATYQTLVNQLEELDLQLERIETQESLKKAELGQRKAELADRIRQAYDAERTSMLETLLSGASFTDMLAEMSTQLDAADQDRILAQQIADDRATLLSLHQTVDETRGQTDTLRQETAVQKRELDLRLADLKKTQAKLAKLEKAVKASLAAQQAQYAKMSADQAQLRKAMATAAAAKKKLQAKIDQLVAAQFSHGNIPSQYNGTLTWPMSGTITQDFGCTGFSWEPAYGSCSHYHNGIDIVGPYGTPVRASGSGRVVYIGWNYADGADPAWIVIIAHSSELTTWYAHLQAKYPVRAGDVVSKGEIIGYEGNTGHSTGAHLHWMVEFNGNFANPRLFT
jgi:murein DD-endopeptidase MepM/ murein hydrolase activator NlpD